MGVLGGRRCAINLNLGSLGGFWHQVATSSENVRTKMAKDGLRWPTRLEKTNEMWKEWSKLAGKRTPESIYFKKRRRYLSRRCWQGVRRGSSHVTHPPGRPKIH